MDIPYSTHYLDNGLKVIVSEDPATPKVSLNVLYRVGARDEDTARTGMAHLFEHLMFGGSKHIADYDYHVQNMGGENNAFTTNDLTNYYITCPAGQLETAMWLESDRMLELDFSQKALDVQKSVVIEEFKQRYLNQPYGDAYLHLRPLHYTTHPYRWMTIGQDIPQIEAVTLDHIRDFFFRFYAPNNATLVVCGGAKTDEVLRLANKWFGPIPTREVRRPARPAEPAQHEARSTTANGAVPLAAVYKAYHIPALCTAGYYAADIVTNLLAGGKSSRLYKRVVRQEQLASTVSAFSWGLLDPGMVSINARLTSADKAEKFNQVVEEELALLADKLTQDELNRATTKVESSEAFEKVSVASRATSLAMLDAAGDAGLINQIPQLYAALTVADVRQALRTWYRADNCSTLLYLPK